MAQYAYLHKKRCPPEQSEQLSRISGRLADSGARNVGLADWVELVRWYTAESQARLTVQGVCQSGAAKACCRAPSKR
jgi:hypothetical protein